MPETKTKMTEPVTTIHSVKAANAKQTEAEQEEQEALWKRSLQFFEAMNDPKQQTK